MSNLLAIIAATSRELDSLKRCTSNLESQYFNKQRVFTGCIHGIELCLIPTGIGRSCVRCTLDEIFERISTHRALLMGICGGVDPGLKTGQSLLPSLIQDIRGEFVLKVPLSDWPVLKTLTKEIAGGSVSDFGSSCVQGR